MDTPEKIPDKRLALINEMKLPTYVGQLTDQQMGWLSLSNKKSLLVVDLEKGELEVQAKLLNIKENKDLESVQSLIKDAKNIAAEKEEQRKNFTGMINERLVKPLMEYEKRSLVLIIDANGHELELRKTGNAEANKIQAKNNEIAAFKAHCVNENYRRANEFKQDLQDRISHYYREALQRKMLVNVIPALIIDIKRDLTENFKPPVAIKYDRKIISDDEAKAIYLEVKPYDPAPDLATAIASIETKFALYGNDLKDAGGAIKSEEQEREANKAKAQQTLGTETAINTLAAVASVGSVDAPKLKKSLDVVVEGDKEAWAQYVIINSMKNWQVIKTFFKVKSWDKLSLGQMASALGKLASETDDKDFKLEGLTLREVVK